MKLMLQQHCQSVLTLFIIIAVMGLSGGNGRAQAPDTGLIKRDWRLVGVYVGEVGRTGNKLPAMGFVKVREANSKGGSADIEVRGATGLLFRQKFSWDFLQDMSMVKAGQPYKVMFRMEGERPTVNSGSVYLWFNGGASPKLWELYFPSILKGPWVFNRTVGTPRSYVQIDPEGSSPNSSAEVEFLFEGDNGNSASVPAFSSFWFNPYIGNGVEWDSVEIQYLFAAEAIVPPGGAAVPPLTLPTDGLPSGVTFYPPASGPTVAPPVIPTDPSMPPGPPLPPLPPVPPTVPSNPPVPPIGEPFDTLQGQNCIREWAGLVEQIRNELYPDQGPWQFNQYGILENRAVTSAYEPDGWMSTYGGNPYLFIWLNGGREHENADYAGRLPSLYAYVAECSGG
ncbi:MAG TPA: hypothetical protein PK529_07240, partial [Verrucomicrobiales bacterium]|nr:hypothetical protein [Verrucomicrobiales bacterium]